MKGAEGLQGSNQQVIWGGNNMFNKMKKLLSVGAVVASAAVLLTGCGGGSQQASSSSGSAAQEISGKISASGSTALLPLLKPAQEAFQDKYEKVTVNIAGGGSFTGMNQVAEGSVQIGNSDVNLPDEYKDKGLVDHKVVVEPFVFIVDKNNKVDSLTKQQAVDILTGKITNWKEVGGKDGKIVVVSRDSSSGTFECWNELIMKKERVAPSALMQASNGAVVQAVAKNPNAIGYIGLGYLNSTVKGLHVDKKEPTAQNALSKTWPISRELYIFTNGEPQGDAKALVTYLLDPTKGQKNVAEVGYIPLGK